MIGSVEFAGSDHRRHFAVLGDDCKWTCEGAPVVARVLNALLKSREQLSDSAAGNLYMAAVHEAAEILKGVATIEPKQPLDHDAVN